MLIRFVLVQGLRVTSQARNMPEVSHVANEIKQDTSG